MRGSRQPMRMRRGGGSIAKMAAKKSSRRGKLPLTSQEHLTKLVDVKAVIQQRMKEFGWGPYDLAKVVKGKVTAQTVYSFVKGDGHMSTKTLPHLLKALRLRITPED